MSVAEVETPRTPMPNAPLMRFSADRYEELTRLGVFGTGDKVELINGYLVEKMPQNDAHSFIVDLLSEIFLRALPPEWTIRCQFPVRMSFDTLPEPDAVIVPGPKTKYRRRKPRPKDIAIAIEVSDSSLRYDRTTKYAIYARDLVPVYWIVNIPDEVIEVYALPKAGRSPSYSKKVVYAPGSQVPVMLNAKRVGEVNVDSFFA